MFFAMNRFDTVDKLITKAKRPLLSFFPLISSLILQIKKY